MARKSVVYAVYCNNMPIIIRCTVVPVAVQCCIGSGVIGTVRRAVAVLGTYGTRTVPYVRYSDDLSNVLYVPYVLFVRCYNKSTGGSVRVRVRG